MQVMRPTSRPRPVVLAVASGGGHWVQMLRLAPAFGGAEVHYATPDRSAAARVAPAPLHVYPDANKDTPLRLLACALRLAVILLRVRPDVVVSTGAAGGLVAIALARRMGARTMFIDSIANARELSVSGRLALGLADRVLCQWPQVADLSGAEYRGAVL
jgi:UDP-N-acetylglucosamine:LPS N-acetylglucosamine transferase